MRDELRQDWGRLAREMVSSFTDERALVVKKKIIETHRARVSRRRIAAVVFGVFLLAASVWILRHRLSPTAPSPMPSIPSGSIASLGEETFSALSDDVASAEAKSVDAPRAVPLSAGTRFSVEEELSTSTYHIVKGMIRFETGGNTDKKLVVHVGTLTIEDIGTVFTVETVSSTEARVSVTEGRVLITWPSGRVELKHGNEGIFPMTGDVDAEKKPSQKPHVSASPSGGPDWREAAEKGENARALRLIDEDASRVQDRVDDLLLAADVMRLTGHSNRAVPYLERVVNRFSRDSRSASAAFTLGKVFLDELKKPREAAVAFSAAAQNNSPLAEEASAREVEAWSRAKESLKAHEAAMRYLHKYPNGARAGAVRTLGNIAP